MNLIELALAAALTAGAAVAASDALDLPVLRATAEAVASTATCRSIEAAIVAYTAEHDAPPADIAELEPYVRGDLSGYRIAAGTPAGPGCPPATP